MRPFPQPLTGLGAPLLIDNIDTDTIIPSREMRSTGRAGLSAGLFAPWRYLDADARTEDPDFILNDPRYRNCALLLGGANFGCGSSREHAVWALAEWGVDCIIAESFAPIFRNNCITNGILPITASHDEIAALGNRLVEVDLGACEVRCDEQAFSFTIEAEAKQMLAQGLDAIDLTLTGQNEINDWIHADRAKRPWVYLEHTP
ncbi:MAG: 3-isopropylmalate dehydratase small subunit [Erythrobacter sp.]